MVPVVMREFGVEKLGPGDGILTNYPFLGGVHLNDVSLISPLYYEGKILGYLVSLAHHVDVGGGTPASIGAFKEIYQERIIIPPVRLVKGGEIDDDLFRFFVADIHRRFPPARYFLCCLTDPDLPVNAGFYQAPRSTLKEKIVVNNEVCRLEMETKLDLAGGGNKSFYAVSVTAL